MMLFEAMPLTLHDNKRKNTHCHKEVPLPKKLAVEHQSTTNGQSGLTMNLSDSRRELILPNGVHVSQIPPSSESLPIGRRKASLDAQLPHYYDTSNAKERVFKCESNMVGQRSMRYVADKDILVDKNETDRPVCDVSMFQDNQEVHKALKSPQKSGKAINSGVISRSLKQPSLVLTHLKKNGDMGKCSPDKPVDGFKRSFYETGGYIRRMASLNASACVAALIEPEKRSKSHKNGSGLTNIGDKSHLRQESVRSLLVSPSDDFLHPRVTPNSSPHMKDSLRTKEYSLSPARLDKLSTSSLSSEADSSKDSDELLEVATDPQVYTLLALASSLASAHGSELEFLPYNKLGLLYNGDTLHPNARMFYTSDTELTMPDRVIPRVVPSQQRFVRSAISDALAQISVKRKRKPAKVRYVLCGCI